MLSGDDVDHQQLGNDNHRTKMIGFGENSVSVEEEATLNSFTRQYIWRVHWPVGIHELVFRHSTLGGRRKCLVNGEMMFSDRKLLDTGSIHRFMYEQHEYEITIATQGMDFEYRLKVDGFVLRDADIE
eukprot:TRINITY_DN2614_c0_g1_i1.p1 TRINITY_DN2614_c0_g1~~TRINITY_DN2614_c0_g1_i1.p1  ORF type:complete len:128 (+),score=26.37 TRINITY_DN2614_c0_g1_i1:40-423(+)